MKPQEVPPDVTGDRASSGARLLASLEDLFRRHLVVPVGVPLVLALSVCGQGNRVVAQEVSKKQQSRLVPYRVQLGRAPKTAMLAPSRAGRSWGRDATFQQFRAAIEMYRRIE